MRERFRNRHGCDYADAISDSYTDEDSTDREYRRQ